MKGMKSMKRAFAVFLAFCMVFTSVGITAFADETSIPDWTADAENQIATNGAITLYNASGGAIQEMSDDVWVKVSKMIEDSTTKSTLAENEFEITLNVETRMDVQNDTQSSDASAVLVLDMSGSMYMCATCGGGSNGSLGNHATVSGGTRHACNPNNSSSLKITTEQTRYYAVREAAKEFVNTFAGSDERVQRYIAIVPFGSSGVASQISDKYWVDVAKSAGKTAVINYLGSLTAFTSSSQTATNGYYTAVECGLAVARNLYIKSGVTNTNTRILPNADITNNNVILFTDGNPNRGGNSAASTTGLSISSNGSHNLGNTQTRSQEIKNGSLNAGSHLRHSATLYGIGYAEANIQTLKNMVNGTSGGTGLGTNVYSATTANLPITFQTISKDIVTFADAWVVTDPMGQYIDWSVEKNAPLLDLNHKYDPVKKEFAWDLKNISGTKGDDGWYRYSFTYTVTLDTIAAATSPAAFDSATGIPANGKTELSYYIVKDGKNLTETAQIAEFKVPKVFGYKADFGFTKTDKSENALEGFVFEVYNGTDKVLGPITSDALGDIAFEGISSGNAYLLKEVGTDTDLNPDAALYNLNDKEYRLVVSYGQARILNDANQWVASGDFNFINQKSKGDFNVYYKYFVNGKAVTEYQEDGVYSEWLFDGASYNIASAVENPYHYKKRDYSFVCATNSDTVTDLGAKIPTYDHSIAIGEGYAVGTISGASVYVDLYYMDKKGPKVSLTKKITKDSDEKWPTEFTFNFTLVNEANKEVATLNMTKANFNIKGSSGVATERFSWASDVDFAADVLGQTLYLSETSICEDGTWNASFTDGVKYVKIDAYGKVTYLKNFVKNDYEQTPAEADVIVKKFFKGNLENFIYQGNDGSEIGCEYAMHEHDESCLEMTCKEKEHDSETCEDCLAYIEDPEENDPCELLDHEHDADCSEVACKYVTEEHDHDADCYRYTFTFELYKNSRYGKGTLLATQTLTLSAAEIRALNEEGKSKKIVFENVDLPEKGVATYTIKEKSTGYEGWTLSQKKTVQISRLGEVKYLDKNHKGYVKMVNWFDGMEAPAIEFSKSVIDGRNDEGPVVEGFNGTFDFELWDITDSNPEKHFKVGDTITLEIEDGLGGYTIDLPQYLGKDATLELREIPNSATGGVEGEDGTIEYDSNVFTIYISNGEIVESEVEGYEFENVYYSSVIPDIQIIKTTNGRDGEFKFEISYTEDNTTSMAIQTEDASGTDTFTLPMNYTGTVTVTEVQDWVDGAAVVSDGTQEGKWFFDNEQYTFIYENGILLEGSGEEGDGNIAAFNNNYTAPEVEITKSADQTSVRPNTTVNYTLLVTNVGNEVLTNAAIYDDMFVGYEGSLIVTKKLPGEGTTPETLVLDTDYAFNKTTGTITILGEFGIGEIIAVNYAITFTTTGSKPNEATVEAIGVETEIGTKDDADRTVTVSTGDGGGRTNRGGGTTPNTTIPEPTVPLANLPEDQMIIPEPDVPLADVPQTGEESNIAFNLAMLGISLSALLTLLAGRRKKEQ